MTTTSLTLRDGMPWLVAALAAVVGLMTWAARHDFRLLSAAVAGLFAVGVVAVAAVLNRRATAGGDREPAAQFHMLRRNTRLVALIYGWGAAAMLSVYTVSGLHWRHGWQYGLAMALIAAGLIWYVRALGHPGTRRAQRAGSGATRGLMLLHALAAAGGIVFLVASGKLSILKSDWAVNHVFVAGGLAVIALSLISARTHAALKA